MQLVEIVGRAEGQGTCPGEGVGGSEVELVGDVMQYRGFRCHPNTVWSDPRLEGTETYIANFDNYGENVSGTVHLHTESYMAHIENDEGGWRMRPTLQVIFDGSIGWEDGAATTSVVFDGEGDYEGLMFVGQQSGDETRGYIIEGDFPPDPVDAPME